MAETESVAIGIRGLFSGFLMLALFSGCATVGPDYSPPKVEIPEKWNASVPEGEQGAGDISAWWERLNDPLLTSLVMRAVESNKDLKTAIGRVREARARLGVSEAGRYPTLDAEGSARWSESESKTNSSTTRRDSASYSGGLDSAWEIDLFGGTRRAIEAAGADLSAQEEAMKDVRVTLAAEVALTYITLRELQQRIAITESSLSVFREEADIVRIRKDTGLVSDLDVAQAEENLASTEAQLPSLHDSLNESLNSLAILLGQLPGTLHEELSAPSPVPSASEGIEVGVPADLLRRRPDVRRAERELAAETARVGVAVSELYPKFSLAGSFGYERLYTDTGAASSVTKTLSAGIGPSVRWQIFNGGAVRRNIEAQDARQEQALIAYEQTVLSALGEVENAIVSHRETEREVALLRKAVAAARETEEMRNTLYFSGLDDIESLLNAKRNLLSLENRLVSARAAAASKLVSIYKALGGGWTPEQEPVAAAEQGDKADN